MEYVTWGKIHGSNVLIKLHSESKLNMAINWKNKNEKYYNEKSKKYKTKNKSYKIIEVVLFNGLLI